MLSIYMDVATFDAGGGFADDVTSYLDFARSAKPIKADNEVLRPGDPERRRRAAYLADGIPLEDTTWTSLVDLAGQYQVRIPEA